MVNTMTKHDAAAWLLDHDNYCILTHGRPDGDTIGSAATLCLGLRQLGKTAHVLENTECSPFLRHCCEGLTKSAAADDDTIICVDVASPGMIPDAFRHLTERIRLRIDHHASATSFTELELVDPSSAACGELIYDILMDMGVRLDRAMGSVLYVAVSTDTGCFRYANTTAHTYLTAAACAETGADLYPLTQELFDTTSINELRLRNWMVENALFLCDGQVAVCAIPRQMEDTVTREELEGISGFLRSIEGVKIAATLRQVEEGSKLSVRAVPGYDATIICKKFGGGGHKGAAGATIGLPLQAAAELVAAELKAIVVGK